MSRLSRLRARVRVSICQWVTSWVGVLAAAAAQLPQALVEVLRAQLPQGVVKVLASAAAQLPQALAEVLREQPQGVVEVLPPQLPEAEGVVDSYVSARRNLCCFISCDCTDSGRRSLFKYPMFRLAETFVFLISCDFTASGDHPPA